MFLQRRPVLQLFVMMMTESNYVQAINVARKLHSRIKLLETMNQLGVLRNRALMKVHVERWLCMMSNSIKLIVMLSKIYLLVQFL